LRYLNPLPEDLGGILGNFKRVLLPELNLGQLRMLLRAKYLVDIVGFNLVRGKPFQIGEIEAKAESLLGESVEVSK
jgi:2-oxoglutarate ferredoxin oxidoreductase subunit alpha